MSLAHPRTVRANLPIVLGAVFAIAVAGLVAVPAAALASGSSPGALPSAGSSAGTWAFGNVTAVTFHGQDGQGVYSGTLDYGFVTNVTSLNTSATTVEVVVQETVGLSLSLQYCRPTCSSPVQFSNFSYQAWQTRDAWTNVSTASTVLETFGNNDTVATVAALGIINSTSLDRAALVESATDVRTGIDNVTRVSSLNASYEYSSNATVAFTPALGLYPTAAVIQGDSWVATALYQASADWGANWLVELTGPRGNTASYSGSLGSPSHQASGSVTIAGSAGSGPRVHSVRLLSLDYTLGANFVLGPGLAVTWALPGAFGAGLPGTSSWAQNARVVANVGVNALATLPGAGLVDRLQSSELAFSLRFNDPNNGAGVNDTTPSQELSGTPLSSGQAGSTASCLQQSGGSVCSTVLSSGGGTLGTNGTVVLVSVSVVVLAVIVAAVVVARQRRIPPPQYPNAGLYPPGQTVGPSPGQPSDRKAANRPSDGPTDDPLDQLW